MEAWGGVEVGGYGGLSSRPLKCCGGDGEECGGGGGGEHWCGWESGGKAGGEDEVLAPLPPRSERSSERMQSEAMALVQVWMLSSCSSCAPAPPSAPPPAPP